MEQIELQVTTRETTGKKVRFLRRQGITPVHLFGQDTASLALQCNTAELRHILAEAGKTKLIRLKLDKAKQPRNVLVREVQIDHLAGELLHVDFYEVKMAESIRVEVPIVLSGEAPALKAKDNMLEQALYSLTVECLPDVIPPSVEIDLDSLTEVELAIRVKDVQLGEGITVLNDPEYVVVKVSAQPAKREEGAVEEEVAVGEAAPIAEPEAESGA